MPTTPQELPRTFDRVHARLAAACVVVALGPAAACGGGKSTAPPAGNAGSQPGNRAA